uniref:Uncharacterized protein n=1 Tax=Anopheles dirus TaxID=7168 RepID=A0A182NWE1_9DIPT
MKPTARTQTNPTRVAQNR